MKDLVTNTNPAKGLVGDMLLDAGDDLAEFEREADIVLAEIREHFEMRPADDIDYPELYSRQRRLMNSHEDSDSLERLRDAERILAQHPAIRDSSISVSLETDKSLTISFQTLSGVAVTGFTMA